MRSGGNQKNTFPVPSFAAENNFGDYVTALTKILRDLYRIILRNNGQGGTGSTTFDVRASRSWRAILRLPGSRVEFARLLLTGDVTDTFHEILQANRPANVSYDVANTAIEALVDLFEISRAELDDLAAQAFSTPDEGSTTQSILNRAIVPIAYMLHNFFDLLDEEFTGFGIAGLPAGSAVGTLRVTLSTDPKIAIRKTKNFGIKFRFERIVLPRIEIGGTNREIIGLPLEKIFLTVKPDIDQPISTRFSQIFDHDIQEGSSLKLTLKVNPRDGLMAPYDVTDIPRLGGNRQNVQALISSTMGRILGDGLVNLAARLEDVLPQVLRQYFVPSHYNAGELLSRVRPKNSNPSSGQPLMIYPDPIAKWASGRLRVEALKRAGASGDFDHIDLGEVAVGGRQTSFPPRSFESAIEAQDDVLNLRSAGRPDWPNFSRNWKRPGRVRLASNAVAPSLFARHFIRDLQPVKALKVGRDFSVKIQSLSDIALDFQGAVIPAKAFADSPALLIRGMDCLIENKGRSSVATLEARIRLFPLLLSHGPLANDTPRLGRSFAQSYNLKSDFSDLSEHVHFRNFVFLHQTHLNPQVEILPTSTLPNNLNSVEAETFLGAWARAIPAIPVMIDPWFPAHPSARTLRSSRDSASQGQPLPEIETGSVNFIEEALRNWLLSYGVLRNMGEPLLDTQSLDPSRDLVSNFESVRVRNGWIVMDRTQSIFDIFNFGD